VACKKDEPPPPPAPAVAPAVTAPPAAPAKPCPAGTALAQAAASARSIKPADVTEVSCNDVTEGGRKLWAIDMIAMTPDSGFEGTLALVDARDGKLVWKDKTGERAEGLPKADVEAADLDGDGSDELLRSATVGGNGYAHETLYVLAWRGDKLVEVGALPVRSENTGAVAIGAVKQKDHYECQSEHKVADKRIVIVAAKRKGKPPAAECPPEGTHLYAFDGKTVTEAKP